MARVNLSTYPGFNETFKIHTDAITLQLGLVISHKGKPINFYSIKYNGVQQRYTVTERELISIFETLKYFLRIYTDHKNLTCTNFNTDRLLICGLILKEYGPDIEYIKVEKHSSRHTINISLKW